MVTLKTILKTGGKSLVILRSFKLSQVITLSLSLPHQAKLPTSPNFSKNEVNLIDDEVQKLIKKGAITEVTHCKNEFISNIFLVPKKTGDFRPVINLKPLNHFVDKIHFKMENIQNTKYYEQGYYIYKIFGQIIKKSHILSNVFTHLGQISIKFLILATPVNCNSTIIAFSLKDSKFCNFAVEHFCKNAQIWRNIHNHAVRSSKLARS